jgi:hypothetical protein
MKIIVLGEAGSGEGEIEQLLHDDAVHVCAAILVLSDSGHKDVHELAVCTGRSRERHLYTSVGHQVSFYVTNSESDSSMAAEDGTWHAAHYYPRFVVVFDGTIRYLS